jgi:hypothetical protein
MNAFCPGHSSQRAELATTIASQKALPNESLAHAAQLLGSPEQAGDDGDWVLVMGKIGFMAAPAVRRGRGTGGWYAGRLSRMETELGDEGDESGRSPSSELTEVVCENVSIFRGTCEQGKAIGSTMLCCKAISLQTQGVFSLHNPQSNVEYGADSILPISFLMSWGNSMILVMVEPWLGKRGISRGGEWKDIGEYWWSELPLEAGDETIDGGDDA